MADGIQICAVIGHPVAHSLSPEIFRILSRETKRPVIYKRIDLHPQELEGFYCGAAHNDLFVGWNVTIPHKEAMRELVEVLAPDAKTIGAVNVVQFGKRPKGFNTDVIGVRETLREQGVKMRGQVAVMYGAGGAAKAVAHALVLEGAKTVWVTNRNEDRAKALCRQFGKRFKVAANPREVTGDIRLVVNSTPTGMKGQPGSFVFPPGVGENTLAFDLIYRPAAPVFVRQAKKLGASSVNGLDMLVWQAIATWEIWFGRLKNRHALKARISEELCRFVI